jgi:hypothetical protein
MIFKTAKECESKQQIDKETQERIDELIQQNRENKQTIDELLAKRQKIIEASTEFQLQRIDEELRAAQSLQSDIQTQQSRLEHKIPISDRQQELTREITDSLRQEQLIRLEFSAQASVDTNGQSLSEEHIRPDAVEVVQKQVREAEAEVKKVEEHFRKYPNSRAVGSSLDPQRKLEKLRSKLPALLKVAQAGQQVYKIRERRKALIAERDELQEERRQFVYGK